MHKYRFPQVPEFSLAVVPSAPTCVLLTSIRPSHHTVLLRLMRVALARGPQLGSHSFPTTHSLGIGPPDDSLDPQ